MDVIIEKWGVHTETHQEHFHVTEPAIQHFDRNACM